MSREMENMIKELDGVVSCTVTGGEEIDEIHIIADKKRSPKRIVRDVETVFLVNNNQKIDHKKISIARIRSDISKNISEFNSNRAELITVYTENNRSCCTVKMLIDDQTVEEHFEAQLGEKIEKLIARAIIDMINKYFDLDGHLLVEDIFVIKGKEEIVIAQITKFDNDRNKLEEKLVGAVYLENNITLAIAKACLKAVNRKLYR